MGSSEENVRVSETNIEVETVENEVGGEISESEVADTNASLVNVSSQSVSEANTSKDDASGVGSGKKAKKKFRHGKKGHVPAKDNIERSTLRRVHYTATKFKQGRKRAQSFPTISKFFLPHKRPRKEVFIPPTKFLLGGNISDPLNLNSLQDEDINRAMNAVTPESSPLPTPPRHKAKIDVIIPPNIRDPLNLMEPVDNEEYEKRLEMQQRKPRKKPRIRRRTTDNANIASPTKEVIVVKEEGIKEPPPPEPSTSKSRKRSCSDSDNSSQKGKDGKKLRRMDSLDKIVSPVVPQPGAWMRARPQPRTALPERPASPRAKLKTQTEGEQKLPTFHPKNSKYQYGNYDRYYGYRNLNAMMDVRLQVFEMHRHLFQNKDVLDIGCNVGHVTIAVARNLGARSVVGIDIDPALIGRARKNLQSFIPVPVETPKVEEDKKPELDEEKKSDCDKCKEDKCEDCPAKQDKGDEKKISGRKLRRPRKNRKSLHRQEQGQCFFPMSMSMLYGPLCNPATQLPPPTFPYNVTFKQGNYVPREDIAVGSGDSPQFDLILCLSTTKWLHLNWGDAGLKRAFRRMFADLRPGGKLVLEAQNWASYKKKKRLTPTIYENFNSIELLPNKFREFLLSPEVGFSKCCILGVPQHASKGFRRPIQLYIKGDFTPSKASWSDAYAPSSHHRPEAEPPRRTVYAPVAPAYRPSDDAPSCGAATPYSPNLATLLYRLGHVSDALKEIRECLKLDPEHKKCFPFYKKVKKVDKFLLDCEQLSESRDFAGCIASANKVLKTEDEVTLVVFEARKWLCSCSVKEELYTEALAECGAALALQRDARVLCDRADALLGLDMFEDAIHSFKEALELEEGLQRAKDGISRAQKLQKQSEQRDYYKILNVKRSASKQEIIKAYRKAAQKWHPDNFQGDEKKLAEKKFIDVAAAKEVLTDPEKRAQFDAGTDPLDPEAQRQGGGPFHSPFHHFQHGSPFQFKFHFN